MSSSARRTADGPSRGDGRRSPAGVAGYGIGTKATNGPDLDHTIAVWAVADDKPAGVVVDPASAEFEVITEYRNTAGDVLASVSAPFRAPAISC